MARKSRVVRTIHIGLHEPEAEIIQKLEEQGSEFSERIREMIRDYGRIHFPPEPGYVEAQKARIDLKKKKLEVEAELENMSPEDYTVKVLGARVVEVEGAKKIEFKRGNGQSVFAPLANVKEVTPENNTLAGIHKELVDREYVDAMGKELTDERYAKIFEGWDFSEYHAYQEKLKQV
jgi:hypothetical protein